MTPSRMSPEEIDSIKRFASGEEALRPDMHGLYLKYVSTELESLPLRFLSETFSPVPDYTLRSMYRRKLLEM